LSRAREVPENYVNRAWGAPDAGTWNCIAKVEEFNAEPIRNFQMHY